MRSGYGCFFLASFLSPALQASPEHCVSRGLDICRTIKSVAEDVNKRLPVYHQRMTYTHVKADYHEITHYYRVDYPLEAAAKHHKKSLSELRELQSQGVRQKACGRPALRSALTFGAKIHYEYQYADCHKIRFTLEECPPLPKPPQKSPPFDSIAVQD